VFPAIQKFPVVLEYQLFLVDLAALVFLESQLLLERFD